MQLHTDFSGSNSGLAFRKSVISLNGRSVRGVVSRNSNAPSQCLHSRQWVTVGGHIKRHTSNLLQSSFRSSRQTPKSAPAQSKSSSQQRSLIQIPVREAKVVENESNINKKLLASAAVVCLATNLLTVQGLLLTAYAGALTAVPVGAVRHALKKRNAWPALLLLSSAILIPNIAILRGAYTSLVNPVSVQLKARVTLPAIVHAFVGSKHPILKGSFQAAQVISQMVLVGLLLQYLLAPKIAETMRQKAIMLCRALTTTETQALKKEREEMTAAFKAEEWRTDEQTSQKGSETPSPDFVSSISRGKPRRREGLANKPTPLQREALLNLPAGQQPSIAETYSHPDTEYAFLRSQKKRKVAAGGSATTQLAEFRDADLQELFEGPTDEEIAQARTDLAELGLTFESDMDSQSSSKATPSPNSDLNSVVGSITSTEELFGVLNEQLNMVQDLSDEVRHKGKALMQSEYAREDLLRELKATVGEKDVISKELSHLALKFEAAQSMWEKHMEQGGSFGDLISDDVLDKVVTALNERKRHLLLDYVELQNDSEDIELAHKDRDAITDKIRQLSDDNQPSQGHSLSLNNVQPFERSVPSEKGEAQLQQTGNTEA